MFWCSQNGTVAGQILPMCKNWLMVQSAGGGHFAEDLSFAVTVSLPTFFFFSLSLSLCDSLCDSLSRGPGLAGTSAPIRMAATYHRSSPIKSSFQNSFSSPTLLFSSEFSFQHFPIFPRPGAPCCHCAPLRISVPSCWGLAAYGANSAGGSTPPPNS